MNEWQIIAVMKKINSVKSGVVGPVGVVGV